VENLTLDELYEAGVTRGIVRRYGTIDGLAPEERRQKLHELLQDWVELTDVPVPIYLHLLARVNVLEKAAPLSSALVVPTIEPVTPETLPLEPSTAETVTVPTLSVPEPTPTILVPPTGEKVVTTQFVLQGYADVKKMFLPQLIEVRAARALQAETTKQTEDKLQKKINSKIESMVTEIEDELKKIDPKIPVVETPVTPSKEVCTSFLRFSLLVIFFLFNLSFFLLLAITYCYQFHQGHLCNL
jgi:hypothetical protein